MASTDGQHLRMWTFKWNKDYGCIGIYHDLILKFFVSTEKEANAFIQALNTEQEFLPGSIGEASKCKGLSKFTEAVDRRNGKT